MTHMHLKHPLSALLVLALTMLPGVSAAKNTPSVLSLDLCTDWMLATYAEPAQVVALSPLLKTYPAEWIQPDWPTHNGRLEKILELKPDLVIVSEFNALQLRKRLQSLDIRVETLLLPKRLPQIRELELQLLSFLGQPASLARTPPLLKKSAQTGSRPRLLVLGANAIGTGRQTVENDIIEYAGWQNYLAVDGYISLDIEQLITDPPDAIMWSTPPSRALANNFAMHTALRKAVPASRWLNSNYARWHCYGPWTIDVITQLEKQLQQWYANQH